MAEIKVTYETLFDLLRREKGRNDLQELEKTFYEDVKEYIDEKNNTLKTTISRGEKEKINIQLKNIKKILRELYDLREKKIINLAASKVRTNSNLIDTSKLLEKEKSLYNEACELFLKYKLQVIEKIINSDDVQETPQVKQQEPKEEEPPETQEEQKIKILHDLPRFLGTDKKIYGPYKKGDLTTLPEETAKLLLDKKRAEQA